ncbi:MAG: PEP-CTERM sorting domain-containing protein [Planctomycetes bacterium]|nr:PEP-CTERM sorting domain-containing protein [Planctomycetota bacterium]
MLRTHRFMSCAVSALLIPIASLRASELYGSSVVRQMLVTLDLRSGDVSDVGSLGDYIQDITFNSNDGFIYGFEFEDDQTLRRISPADGTNVPIGQPITDYGWSNMHGMAYSPEEDRLFATTFNGELLSVDPETGIPTHVGTLPAWVWGLAYNTLDQSLYGVSPFADGVLWQIDTDDATAKIIGQLGVDGGIEGLAFDPIRQQLLAVVIDSPWEDSLLIGIDPQTAATTPIGEIGSNDFISGLAYVPEPATFVLVMLGGMPWLARRRVRS